MLVHQTFLLTTTTSEKVAGTVVKREACLKILNSHLH